MSSCATFCSAPPPNWALLMLVRVMPSYSIIWIGRVLLKLMVFQFPPSDRCSTVHTKNRSPRKDLTKKKCLRNRLVKHVKVRVDRSCPEGGSSWGWSSRCRLCCRIWLVWLLRSYKLLKKEVFYLHPLVLYIWSYAHATSFYITTTVDCYLLVSVTFIDWVDCKPPRVQLLH